MTELATLARPYAEAVFKRASETGETGKWTDMLAFLTVVISDKQVLEILENPKTGKDRLGQFVLDIADGQVNAEGVNFLKLLIQNRRLTLIPAITELYEGYRADHEGYVKVDLSAAYALNKDEKLSMAATLEKLFKKKIHMHTSVDKSLIGGVYVQAGDQVIDGSIRGQLQQLAKQL